MSQLSDDERSEVVNVDSLDYGLEDLADKKAELFQKAVDSVKNAVEKSKTSKCAEDVAFLYRLLGNLQLYLKEHDSALKSFQQAGKLNKDFWTNSAFLYGYGLACFELDRYHMAIRVFQKILYTDPDFPRSCEVHARLGYLTKHVGDYESATKCFKLALADHESCSQTKNQINFHLAQLLELQNQFSEAQTAYEELLTQPDLPAALRADTLRQLGWLFHTADTLGDVNTRENSAIQYLQKAIEADSTSGKSWYLLGRCFSGVQRVQDAFLSYRQSIDKSEASADTWCSIGVLYQQQTQPMDALQAYICAVQLDKTHTAAWIDLGILYESVGQPSDALTCYQRAAQYFTASVPPSLATRITLLQSQLRNIPKNALQNRAKTLPSIQEAWSLPIPAELTSRQGGMEQKASPGGGAVAPDDDADPAAKRVKLEQPQVPPLTPQQLQTFTFLQHNQASLNPQQQQLYNQLQHQYTQFVKQQQELQQQQQQQMLQPGNLPFSTPAVTTARQVAVNTPSDVTDGAHAQNTERATALAEDILAQFAEDTKSSQDSPASDHTKVQSEEDDKQAQHNADQWSRDLRAARRKATEDGETEEDGKAKVTLPKNLTIQSTAQEIVQSIRTHAKKVKAKNLSLLPDEAPPPVEPPAPPTRSKEELNPPVPAVYMDDKKHVESAEVQQFCMSKPVVVIKGMAGFLKMDLGLFSTKTLKETAPNNTIEVRRQQLQNPEENMDQHGNPVWKCHSNRNFKTISYYADYQMRNFEERIREEAEDNKMLDSGKKPEKKKKMIEFGTNVDLSDDTLWKAQLQELQKLPVFTRVHSAANMLCQVGNTVLGMNSVQLYMKVPGSRTPGHQENNNFCSVNINIGPGDVEWFNVPAEYWGVLSQLCQKNGVSYLKGSWWPILQDLYDMNVPVYRFVQKPGDLVWVGPGTIHWVQAIGWCNAIAWNVGPLNSKIYQMASERYEYNKLQRYKSIVPMVRLSWNMADGLAISEPKLYEKIKFTLLQTLKQMQAQVDYVKGLGKDILWHGRKKDEPSHYCNLCEEEVFNILYVLEVDKKHVVHCLDCARRKSPKLQLFNVIKQYHMSELYAKYDQFQLANLVVHQGAAGLFQYSNLS